MKRGLPASILFLVPAALSVAFFTAASADMIHIFEGAAGNWHTVLTSSFTAGLPSALVIGCGGIALLWLLAGFIGHRLRGIGLKEALITASPAFLPLGMGLLLPLRYIPHLARFSSALFLVTSTLMGPLLFIAVLVCVYLLYRAFRSQQREEETWRGRTFDRLTDRTVGWLVFAVSLIILLLLFPLYPVHLPFAGDQPHYLIVTHSLIEDGDIFIDDDHEAGAYRAFSDVDFIPPQYYIKTVQDRIIPVHKFGISVLAVGPYLLAGRWGAVLMIVVMAALAAANTYWLTVKFVDNRVAALAATAWVAFSIPALPMSFLFFTEIPTALFLLIAVNLLFRRDATAPPRLPWLLPFLLWAMPWLHTRNFAVAILLSGLLVWRMRRKRIQAAALALLCVVLALGIPLFNNYFYGEFSLLAELGKTQADVNLLNSVRGIAGILFDQEYGAVLYNPLILLSLVGLLPLISRHKWRGVWLFVIFGFSLGPMTLYYMFWGGGSTPARYLAACIHLAAVPLAALIAASYLRRLRPAVVSLLIIGIALGIVLIGNYPLLVNDRDGTSQLLTSVSAGHADAVEWWPSWIAGGVRSWPLLLLLLTSVALSVAGFVLLSRLLSGILSNGVGRRGVAALAGICWFVFCLLLYAPVAETLTPDEPNDHLPRTHESDEAYVQRMREAGWTRVSVFGSLDDDPLPSLRFSAERLFSKEDLTADDKAARRRSRRIPVTGDELMLTRTTPLWAGDYEVRLGMRAEAQSCSAAIEIYDLSDPLARIPDATRRVRLGADFAEYAIPLEMPRNSIGLRLVFTPERDSRLLYILVQPLSLSPRESWKWPPDTFDLAAWRFDDLTLHCNARAVYSTRDDHFWSVGDSDSTWIITSRRPFSVIDVSVRSRPEVSVTMRSGSLTVPIAFDDRPQRRFELEPEVLNFDDDYWYARIRVITKGGFTPAEVDPSSLDHRFLGAHFHLALR